MEERFCDKRHEALEKYIDVRFTEICRALDLKAHKIEEAMKARTASMTLIAAIVLIAIELLFHIWK